VVSEGGFEPPRPIRPLGPQPSASTKFRHSDESEPILATAPERPGIRHPHCQESQNVDAPKIIAVTTVILSRRRSSEVPPDRLEVPPNMSDRPLPLPECSRMNTIRNRLEVTQSTSAMTSNMARQCTGLHARGFVDDRPVFEREVAGRHLAGVMRPELGLLVTAAGELRVRAPGVEAAA
jgi:hypothetical protein